MSCGWGRERILDQERQRFDGALAARAYHRHHDTLCSGAWPRAVSAPDLAIHHRRTDRSLGPMIRRLNRRVDQEPKPLDRVVQDMFRQAPIRLVRETARGQMFQFASQAQATLGQASPLRR